MRRLITIAVAAVACQMLNAQTSSDIRFNELSVVRDSAGNVTSAWVELYNTSCTSVNMTGLFISDDVKDLKKYRVPYGTDAASFQPRGYAVVEVDGRPEEGPLHTTFSVADSKMLYLVQANGRIIIDSMQVQQSGVMARTVDGGPNWQLTDKATKGYSNVPSNGVGNVEKFMKVDPYGGGMALISMSVVFSVLVLLAVVFTFIGRLFKKHDAKKEEKVKEAEAGVVKNAEDADADDLTAVAIAVAIHRNQRHDSVKGKLTMTGKVNRLWKNTFLNTIINQRREWH